MEASEQITRCTLDYYLHDCSSSCLDSVHLNWLQAFIDELIEIGQVEWLKDFHTSPDKKSFLIKVLYFADLGPVTSTSPLAGVVNLIN